MKRIAVNTVFIVGLAGAALASAAYLASPGRPFESAGAEKHSVASVAKIETEPSNPKSTKTADAAQASLQTEVDRLSRDMQQIKALLLASKKAKARNDQTPAVEDPEQQRQQQEEAEYKSLQKARLHFQNQPVDRVWAKQASQRIETAMQSGKADGLTIDSVECRSSICKLEIGEMDDQAIEAFKNVRNQVADVFNSGMIGTDESGKTVVYMSDNYEEINDF